MLFAADSTIDCNRMIGAELLVGRLSEQSPRSTSNWRFGLGSKTPGTGSTRTGSGGLIGRRRLRRTGLDQTLDGMSRLMINCTKSPTLSSENFLSATQTSRKPHQFMPLDKCWYAVRIYYMMLEPTRGRNIGICLMMAPDVRLGWITGYIVRELDRYSCLTRILICAYKRL